jgi:hypothetical protein
MNSNQLEYKRTCRTCGMESTYATKQQLHKAKQHKKCIHCAAQKPDYYLRMRHPETAMSWQQMISRCKYPYYRYYSQKGITVCKSWRNSFKAFLKSMGDREEGHSIDRINSNGNYKPANCRWADKITQTNNRSNSKKLKLAT